MSPAASASTAKSWPAPPSTSVDSDDIRVDGEPLKAHERTRLFLFHKPRGLVTTARDPEGRPTIFDALPDELPRVVAVGRLDINTEGLLLLTNDGGLARVLELPATGWLRRYRVRAHGAIDQAALDALARRRDDRGHPLRRHRGAARAPQGSNVWLTMGLREGKNREIKRVLEHLGLSVNRLIRISFGPFELGDLAEGEVVEARTRVLRDQLGPRLAREAGVDFDAPILDRAEPEPPPAPATETARRAPATARERPPRRPRDEAAPRSAPRREPPRSAGPERKRKHVGALRAEIAAAAAGPRKRIERSATSDRKGRVVAVERVLPTREEERRRELGAPQGRGAPRGPGATRPARRQAVRTARSRRGRRASAAATRARVSAKAAARRGEAANRRRARIGRPRAPRAGKPFEPRDRGEGGERPPRRPGARYGEGRGAERRGGEPAPREDGAPRAAPRAGKPLRKLARSRPRAVRARRATASRSEPRDAQRGRPAPPRRVPARASAPRPAQSGGAANRRRARTAPRASRA